MTVYRLYRNKAFEPDAISVMTSAYAEVCRTLGLSERDNPELPWWPELSSNTPSAVCAIRPGFATASCRRCKISSPDSDGNPL